VQAGERGGGHGGRRAWAVSRAAVSSSGRLPAPRYLGGVRPGGICCARRCWRSKTGERHCSSRLRVGSTD